MFFAAAAISATPARMQAMLSVPSRPRLVAASSSIGRRRIGQRPTTMPSRRLPLPTTAASAIPPSNDSDPLVRAARSAASAAAAAAEKLKLREKLDATAKAASEAASAADAKWRLSSRARAAAVDARRLYPYYRGVAKRFAATPLGQAAAVAALLLLLWTGVLGRLLHVAFLVYWLAPLLLLPLAQAGASRAQKEQQQQQQQRARAAGEEARRRARWGSAADWFGGGTGGSSSGSGGSGSGSSGRGRASSPYSEGEIIDVEVDS